MKRLYQVCKRGIALFLGAVLSAGMVSLGVAHGSGIVSYAADFDLTENFNSYSDTNALIGYKFGSPTLSIAKGGIDGTKALLVSNRTENYYAYTYNVNKYRGNTVKVSFDVKLPDLNDGDKKDFSVKIKTAKAGEDDSYNCVVHKTITGPAATAVISEGFSIPADVDTAEIYFETEANVDYILDNVRIEVVGTYDNPSFSNKYADISSYESLKDLYKDYFKFGVACESIANFNNELCEIGNPYKEALILQEFNSITFGNELKPEYNMGYKDDSATETYLPFVINPSAKEMLDFAKDNDIKLRGHVLVSQSQCPDAIFCKNYIPVYKDAAHKALDPSCFVSKDVMLQRLESYIYSTMEYMYENGYGATIYAWDVVNEAVEPGTNEYNLRDSYWYKTIGPDYVYYAFKYARESSKKFATQYADCYDLDPSNPNELNTIEPKLFYNDYNEYQQNKRDAIIGLLTKDINGQHQ